MTRVRILLPIVTALAYASEARAQVERSDAKRFGEPATISAEARSAVRSVLEDRQKLKAQADELRDFALELEQVERLLVRVMTAPSSADLTKLEDHARRMSALLEVVKAKSPESSERAQPRDVFQVQCQRLLSALDAILAADTPEIQSAKSGELLRDLTLASPDRDRGHGAPTIQNALTPGQPIKTTVSESE